jgi:uncharacterized membrane protein/nitrite reductase/ring-hydroxylating ferredoxin subunit
MLKDLLEGKPLRHPIHPMLVHFPIGLFVLSFILDLVNFSLSGRPYLVPASFYAMLLGIITALLAAIPGFVDYTDIRRDQPGKRTATVHMTLNLIVVAIYALNLWIRAPALAEAKVSWIPLVLSVIGIGLLSASGYLGGRLVYDEGIAVGRHKRYTPTPQETLKFSVPDSGFVPIPAAADLGNQETLRIEISGTVLTIAKVDNQLFAFQEFCTHRYGPLSEGCLDGFDIECPWHKSRFDIRTGKVTRGPAKIDLKTFKIETRDGKLGVWLTKGS